MFAVSEESFFLCVGEMKALKVEELFETGSEVLGILEGGEVILGREPPQGGIRLENSAISRSHGVLKKIGNYWFYRDLGSTNGSWVNGKRCSENSWKVVGNGDLLQVADSAVRLRVDRGSDSDVASLAGISSRSIVVLSGDEVTGDFPVPEYGRAVTIGGSESDLPLSDVVDEIPVAVIERREEGILLNIMSENSEISLNKVDVKSNTVLVHNDEVQIGSYTLLINEPGTQDTFQDVISEGEKPSEFQQVRLRGWESGMLEQKEGGGFLIKNRSTGKVVFGSTPDDQSEHYEEPTTLAMDSNEVEMQYGEWSQHPSMRRMTEIFPKGYRLSSFEDRLVVFFGFLMLLALMVLLVWWIFT